MTGSDQKLSKIVNYWNTELLCSLESSTSHADPDVAYLDNAIENQLLQEILPSWIQENHRRCLDVGAGYGRFVPTWQQFYSEIVLLEAAPQIYSQLQSLWQNHAGIECKLSAFEFFEDEQEYDLIFASGVLYLYDDEMVRQFVEKSHFMLAERGLLILRDFVAEPSRVTKSNYIKGGSCYYRSSQFWSDSAPSWGFEVLQIKRSKPRLVLLRNSKILKGLRLLSLARLLKHPRLADIAVRFGDWQLVGSGIQTVYLVMRAI